MFLGIALMMSGCSNQIQNVIPQKVEVISIDLASIDVAPMNLQTLTLELVDTFITSPELLEITRSTQPVVFIGSATNKTAEYIDLESINDVIIARLMESKKIRFVDTARLDVVRSELGLQDDHALVNPATAIQFGKMVGAQYMLTSNLVSVAKREGIAEAGYYKLTLRLISLDTGIIEWSDAAEILKMQS